MPAASPATAPFAGRIAQSGSSQDTTVTVTADTRGSPRQHVVITLRGASGEGGGIALSSGRVSVALDGATGADGAAGVFQGPVTSLDGNVVGAVLTGPSGRQVPVRVSLSISGTSVTGRLQVTPGGDE